MATAAAAPAPPLPSGADLLALQRDALRPAYSQCLSGATRQDAQERCVDEEFTYQDGELNRAYQARMAALPSEEKRAALRGAQREWIAQVRQGRCEPVDRTSPAMRLDARQCQLATTISRLRQLNDPRFVATARAAGPTAPSRVTASAAPVFTASGIPDATGSAAYQLGDLRLQIDGAHCSAPGGLLLRCTLAAVVVRGPAGSQSVPIPSLLFAGKTADQQEYVAAYRGPIPPQGEESDGLRYTAIVSDINADGFDDLLLWTGISGRLGAPAYTYHLFDPRTRSFVKSEALAQATDGLVLSGIDGATLHLWSDDGPCKRTLVAIALRGTTPKRLPGKTIDVCK
ncbi:lysozyme inhibitor LprI family protein [Paracidovorax avenae]